MNNETNNGFVFSGESNQKKKHGFLWFPSGMQLLLTLIVILSLLIFKYFLPDRFIELKDKYKAYMFDSIYGYVDDDAKGYVAVD